jgi:hypothetical protein
VWQKEAKGPDMVFMGMGQKYPANFVPVLQKISEIWNDYVHSIVLLVGERQANIDHN